MNTTDHAPVHHAKLGLTGADCATCAFTIEHFGRRLEGVRDVFVDTSQKAILVEYSGSADVLEEIVHAVKRMGYDAAIEDTGKPADTP